MITHIIKDKTFIRTKIQFEIQSIYIFWRQQLRTRWSANLVGWEKNQKKNTVKAKIVYPLLLLFRIQ